MPFTPWATTFQQVTAQGLGLLPWLPADDGFLGANVDPSTPQGGNALAAGTLYLARLPVRYPQTITNLWVNVSTIGADVSGSAFCGLAAPGTGTLLTGSANLSGTFTGTTGWKQLPLTTPQQVTGGTGPASWPFALFLSNLTTTQVSLQRQLNNVGTSVQATANVPQLRWAQQGSFGTVLANVTLSANVPTVISLAVLWS